MTPAYGVKPAKVVPQQIVRLGPWKGVRDVGDAGMQDPAYLQEAVDCWFEDPASGGSVMARPGFQKITSSGLESGATIQGLFGIQTAVDTVLLFAFVNGKLYRQSGATSWTDVSPSGITISSTQNQIHAIVYNGEMIVNDGINEPWRGTSLTSSPITGTEIEINTAGQAWIARGKPTVHGGKLFFIVDDINGTKYHSRIVWSEEGTAATGYLQDGYTNSWDLIQAPVASERIHALQGTDAGLYYFRQFSIGVIYGAVSSDFSTSATHDGVSSDVGIAATLSSPGITPGVLLAKNYIWFVDNARRPCRLRVGSNEVDPVWKQLRRRMLATRQQDSDPDDIRFGNWQWAYSPDLDKVMGMFGAGSANNTAFGLVHVFDAATGNYEGRWAPPASNNARIGAAMRSTQMATAAGDATFIIGASDGNIYHQVSYQMVGGDGACFADAGNPYSPNITTHLVPDDLVSEFRVDELIAEAFPDDGTLSLVHTTPRGSSSTLTATGLGGSDTIQSSHDHGVYRFGLNAYGHFFRAKLTWTTVETTATVYGFERIALKVRGYKATGVSK